ncbi:hypothetical protein [Streptomyces sp. NPDC005953]|uniref:effector-associated constant component EACC1 n=1 Tax=Streptomyces sp. NPDC005953 TaxID=3156719 RepID=UPI0033EB3BDB
MNIDLVVENPSREFRSLRAWLRRADAELRSAGIVITDLRTAPGPEDMGGGLDTVRFVCDTVAQYGALAVAVAAWRDAHAARTSVTFRRGGITVTLTAADLRDQEMIRRALEQLHDDDTPAGSR